MIILESEINAISPAYGKKLGFQIQKTDIKARKVDGSSLNIFGIVIADFQIQNKLWKARFFQEIFLIFKTKMHIVLEIAFLTLSNADI